jgi:hypothetical protein
MKRTEMDHRDGYKYAADGPRSGEDVNEGGQGAKKIPAAAKVIRAAAAIVFFGVPLVTGTAALLGYGAFKAYKRIIGRQ